MFEFEQPISVEGAVWKTTNSLPRRPIELTDNFLVARFWRVIVVFVCLADIFCCRKLSAQVLFSEQVKLRNAITGNTLVRKNRDQGADSARPSTREQSQSGTNQSGVPRLDNSNAGGLSLQESWQSARRDIKSLKQEIERMKSKFSDLEQDYTGMTQQVSLRILHIFPGFAMLLKASASFLFLCFSISYCLRCFESKPDAFLLSCFHMNPPLPILAVWGVVENFLSVTLFPCEWTSQMLPFEIGFDSPPFCFHIK